MSRANIADQGFTPSLQYYVTFSLRNGGIATYYYAAEDGAQIAAGADPKDFPTESPKSENAAGDMGEIGEAEIGSDIAEAGEIGAALL